VLVERIYVCLVYFFSNFCKDNSFCNKDCDTSFYTLSRLMCETCSYHAYEMHLNLSLNLGVTTLLLINYIQLFTSLELLC
jgi:hypothetical protein